MSYADGGIRFLSRPAPKKFVPQGWVADGIRRSVEDGTVEAAAKFVTYEDYQKMMAASEEVAIILISNGYKFGVFIGFGAATGLFLILGTLIFLNH